MIKKYLQKDASGNWNVIPSVSEIELCHINCHKFALFVGGIISREELLSDPKTQKQLNPDSDFTFGKKAFSISQKEFMPIGDIKEIYVLASRDCKEDEVYIGQILDAETGEMAHSFVVEKNPDGKFICFDKAGFKDLFGQYEMGDLFRFENYHNQKWRFVPLAKR